MAVVDTGVAMEGTRAGITVAAIMAEVTIMAAITLAAVTTEVVDTA
jgi:hypothetical protein